MYLLIQFLAVCLSGIIEEGGTREYAFGLVTAERTYHLTSETAVDKK